MILQKLELSAFRGFLKKFSFDLDGDTILLCGGNGLGKTTFFDAIEWCLTGNLLRYETSAIEKRQYPFIVNRFSDGVAQVQLYLKNDNQLIQFIRKGNEKKTEFEVIINDKVFKGTAANEKKRR